jgi:nicotinic acetylcholine receptor
MGINGGCKVHGHNIPPPPPPPDDSVLRSGLLGDRVGSPCRNGAHAHHYCPEVHRAFEGVKFIAEHTRKEEESIRVSLYDTVVYYF